MFISEEWKSTELGAMKGFKGLESAEGELFFEWMATPWLRITSMGFIAD